MLEDKLKIMSEDGIAVLHPDLIVTYVETEAGITVKVVNTTQEDVWTSWTELLKAAGVEAKE